MSCCYTIYLDFTLYPILLVTISTPSVVPPHSLYMNNVVYQCSVRLYLHLFVGARGIMSYLRYLCLFVYSGDQHILCCVFCVPYLASFSGLYICDFTFGIL